MSLHFLFLDESQSRETAISSLTGLLIPAHQYADLRSKFYDLLQWSITPTAQVIDWPPELHTNNLLPGESDETKFKVLEQIVDLIVDNKLHLYRVGYYVTSNLKKLLILDENMIGMCWFGLVASLQPVLRTNMLIPVMDGFNRGTVHKFSGMIKSMDVFRAAGLSGSLSIQNSHNILGEVFYSDSQYSVFTQVTDMVSYLRHVNDWSREGIAMTDFKQRLLQISAKLQPSIIHEEIIAMNGEQPPRRNNKGPGSL